MTTLDVKVQEILATTTSRALAIYTDCSLLVTKSLNTHLSNPIRGTWMRRIAPEIGSRRNHRTLLAFSLLLPIGVFSSPITFPPEIIPQPSARNKIMSLQRSSRFWSCIGYASLRRSRCGRQSPCPQWERCLDPVADTQLRISWEKKKKKSSTCDQAHLGP